MLKNLSKEFTIENINETSSFDNKYNHLKSTRVNKINDIFCENFYNIIKI